MKSYVDKLKGIIFIKIISAAMSIVGIASMPYILKLIFDYDYANGNRDIFIYIILYVFAVVVGMFFEYISQSASWKLEEKFNIVVKDDIFKTIINLNYIDFKKHKISDYIAMLNNDVPTFEQYLENMVNMVQTMIQLIIYASFLFALDFRIAILIIVTSSVTLLLPQITGKELAKRKSTHLNYTAKYIDNVTDLLQGFKHINKNTKANIHNENKTVLNKTEGLLFYFGNFKAFANVFSGLGMYLLEICVLIIIVYLLIQQKITIGTAVASMGYIQSFVFPLSFIIKQINIVNESKKVKDKVLDFINQDITIFDAPTTFYNSITFKNFSFKYDTFSIEEFNYEFEKNKKYLIIGPSGSGKSTIVNTLMKYVDGYDGEVLVDGKELKTIDTKELIANINQQEHIFDYDFIKNITVFDSYDLDKIDEIINELDNSKINYLYSSKNTAKDFSGGEKQLLSLVKLLVENKDIIIMDEAFSALDINNARKLQKYILSLKDKTILMISHDRSEEFLNLFDECIDTDNLNINIR